MHLYPADILLPDFSKTDGRLWATVACDQFTGEPEYWQRVDAEVGDAPSTLRLMLPEAFLSESSERVPKIHAAMRSYLDSGVLVPHRRRAVWLDRTQSNGLVRRGLVAAIDLEEYDFSEGSTSPIRATERTVPERIPPRIGVRRGAPLEMPHVMLLIDDPADSILWRFSERAADAYDFDLMEGGGHVRGGFVGALDWFLGILMGILLGALSVLLFLALLFPLVGIFLPSYCDTVAGWMEGSYFAADLYNNNLLLILMRDFLQA